MKRQVKFVVDAAVADAFKAAVVARRGKLALSEEGEKALRLYLAKGAGARRGARRDPLLAAIGMVRSERKANALADKRALYG